MKIERKRRRDWNDTNKVSANIHFYKNENGPAIGVTAKPVIEKDGLYFRDLAGDGRLAPYKDWRSTLVKRAASLAAELSANEKIGMPFVSSWKIGIYQKDRIKVDENGLLGEEIVEQDESISNVEKTHGATCMVKEMGIRHFILHQSPRSGELANWINQFNMVVEGTGHALPVMAFSNSRNEHGETVFGMDGAADVLATWPGIMRIVAAVRGDGPELIGSFVRCIRMEWDVVGMKKGYICMADVMIDPRWQRSYGTFGKDPEPVCAIMECLTPGIQGSSQGVTKDGVTVTIRHFPGGGAKENGFDPHYAQGQWNVYQTEDSLRTYHLPASRIVIDKKASSIMPYYAKPLTAKSKSQYGSDGDAMEMEPIGSASNRAFMQGPLREKTGLRGYVNSDSGISNKMAWGVEELDVPPRIALAINTGVGIINGSLDVFSAREAYERGRNGYYTTQGHPVPRGCRASDLALVDEAFTRAVTRTLKEKFELGMLDNPYRDLEEAEQMVATKKYWEGAYRVHQQSVVLLKNRESLISLDAEKTAGREVYVECFGYEAEAAAKKMEAVKRPLAKRFQAELTEDYREANFAILSIRSSSGEYFHSTKGYLELDIYENKQVRDVDSEDRLADSFHQETILLGAGRIWEIYESLHRRGGRIISNINFTLAWEVRNVEPCTDALLAGFDIYTDAVLGVIMGRCAPTGRMPIILPEDDSVIWVDRDGICVPHNDVPGYHKDKYMPESMKNENGEAYVYRDSERNYYELDFGLTLE